MMVRVVKRTWRVWIEYLFAGCTIRQDTFRYHKMAFVGTLLVALVFIPSR